MEHWNSIIVKHTTEFLDKVTLLSTPEPLIAFACLHKSFGLNVVESHFTPS